ncbi:MULTISPECIES: hypothetical protein [Aeromonas]|uniref:hypothetical protein n=1 Tax=Aeromonas TaxID=642 RepID=UPI0005EE0709|nr:MULTISPECIES: hypothetical protein [Aeromonas]ATP90979.1 hypothetical protein VI35_12940 [Aeromonas caviae]WDF90803.1 hypothetical protein PUB83_00585 [Aeromonas hydrophila subsp. hydrophila]
MQYLQVSINSVDSALTLPVEIYTPSGSLICSGVISSRQFRRFELPLRKSEQADRPHERVYVFAKLPGGATIQEIAELDADGGKVIFNPAQNSPYEWLEWVTPFRSLQHLSGEQTHNPDRLSVSLSRRIGKVWATLWEFHEQRWEATEVHFENRRGNRGIRQLVIDVPRRPHLLQLGGEELAWRLVSLPPGERVNIALTPSPQAVGGDALDITVGRQYPENELVMSYLSRGAIPEASQLTEFMDIADHMLYEKFNDPISAVAGGYALLRTGRLERREDWLRNLVHYFPHIADVKILKAALAREQEGVSENYIRKMLLDAMAVGLPIFSLGMTLLLDNMAAMHRGKSESRQFHRAYLAVQAYVRAKCSNSIYLAFYGKSPAEPLWSPIYGTQQAGAATPVSQGSNPPVFMRRPKGSPRSVRYGATSVILPRAPVSGQMLETSGEIVKAQLRPIEMGRWISLPDLPESALKYARKKRDSAVPSIEIQTLPDYLAGQEEAESAIESAVHKIELPRQSVALQLKSVIVPERAANPPNRQNAKYWQTARIYNSVSVIDEDE